MLKATIDTLSHEFAAKLIAAIRSASFQEILAVTNATSTSPVAASTTPKAPRAKKRLARRSEADLAKVKADIVGLLAKHPKGLRAEEIRGKLGLAKNEVPRPIADALAERSIRKTGEKRATKYFRAAK